VACFGRVLFGDAREERGRNVGEVDGILSGTEKRGGGRSSQQKRTRVCAKGCKIGKAASAEGVP